MTGGRAPSDETNVEAFERMAHDLLDGPDIQVMHTQQVDTTAVLKDGVIDSVELPVAEETTISVEHAGGAEPLQDLADRHRNVVLDRWTLETRDLGGGEVTWTEADYVLTADPHDPYRTAPTTSPGTTASSPTEAAVQAAETSDDDGGDGAAATDNASTDDDTAETGTERLTPTLEWCFSDHTGAKERHVLAGNVMGSTVCGYKHGGTVKHSVEDDYDSVFAFLEEPDLCHDCGAAVVRAFNLPALKVPAAFMEAARGG